MLRTLLKIQILAVTFATAFACKPADSAQSLTLESGGASVDWRLKNTASSTGSVTLEQTGTGATDEANQISKAEVEVASAPDGKILDTALTARQWMPMRSGSEDLKFNVLLTTKRNGLCYANSVLLNGGSDLVSCKVDGLATKDADANELRRSELQKTCERLALLPIQTGSDARYARYDAISSKDRCTCLNGKSRDVLYAAYYGAHTALEFETECKLEKSEASLVSSAALKKLVNEQNVLCAKVKELLGNSDPFAADVTADPELTKVRADLDAKRVSIEAVQSTVVDPPLTVDQKASLQRDVDAAVAANVAAHDGTCATP